MRAGNQKPPWRRRRARPIGWQEAEQIEAKLRLSTGAAEEVARIAEEHQVSRLTIQKIASRRGIRVAR